MPSEIAALSTAELIERLQDVTGYAAPDRPKPKIPAPSLVSGWGSAPLRSADLDWNFLPVESTGGIIRDGKRTASSPVLIELVARGTESVPLLLDHLTDSRPTRCVQTVHFINASGEIADVYDPRDRTQKWQLKTVNQLRPETLRPIESDTYTLRVGDLCFYALGQIVNRRLQPVGAGLATPETYYVRTMTINSPIETPTLAEIARSEWAGLTPDAHRASLLADARADAMDPRRSANESALRHLLYYYPEEGVREVEHQFEAPLITQNMRARRQLLEQLEEFGWPGREQTCVRLFMQSTALPPGDAAQRFVRDDFALYVLKHIRREDFDPTTGEFLTAEIAWWEAWQEETAAAPWFGKNGPMAGLSNMWPYTRKWCEEAKRIVDATHQPLVAR